jgi:hypothetical protein
MKKEYREIINKIKFLVVMENWETLNSPELIQYLDGHFSCLHHCKYAKGNNGVCALQYDPVAAAEFRQKYTINALTKSGYTGDRGWCIAWIYPENWID